MGHVDDRMHTYVYDKSAFDRTLNKVVKQVSLTEQLKFETPIMTNMESTQVIEFMLNNVLATVIFFICLLTYILIFSLMQTDVEERKYEFGVLRTLGLRNSSLITLITIQSLLFSVPGIICGFAVNYLLIQATQYTLYHVAMVDIEMVMSTKTVAYGLFMGLCIPFLANVIPIQQALGQTLRNALDKMRSSLDDVDVQFIRLESKRMSTSQLLVSLTMLTCGVISYYFVPLAALHKDFQSFLYLLNTLLLLIILGLTFLAQLVMPYLEVALLDLILFV